MTDTLGTLQRQRQELERQAAEINHQVAALVKATRDSYANRLDEMRLALSNLPAARAGRLSYRDHKNEIIATIDGRNVTVTVRFAYPDNNYREGLSISTSDDVRITFEGNLPSVKAFMVLITALQEGDAE